MQKEFFREIGQRRFMPMTVQSAGSKGVGMRKFLIVLSMLGLYPFCGLLGQQVYSHYNGSDTLSVSATADFSPPYNPPFSYGSWAVGFYINPLVVTNNTGTTITNAVWHYTTGTSGWHTYNVGTWANGAAKSVEVSNYDGRWSYPGVMAPTTLGIERKLVIGTGTNSEVVSYENYSATFAFTSGTASNNFNWRNVSAPGMVTPLYHNGDWRMAGQRTFSLTALPPQDSLTVNFTVEDLGRGTGSRVDLRIDGEVSNLGVTRPSRGEQRFSKTVSESVGSLSGKKVEVLIGGLVKREDTSPVEFFDKKCVMDLGKIILGDSCDSCKTGFCDMPKVKASLATK